MKLAKQEVPIIPKIPDYDTRCLRAKLILEEALETINALGLHIEIDLDKIYEYKKEINLTEIADGCADLSVVTIGTLSACGIDDFGLLALIDENNLKKFDGNYKIDEKGKVIKPENHPVPDIKSYIESQIKIKEKFAPREIDDEEKE